VSTTYHALPATLPWKPPAVPPTPLSRLRAVAWAGNVLVFGFLLVLLVWSIFIPLESAAIAAGEVEAEFSRKTIQHLEGGIVREIPVKDGDVVATGQVLIRLDATRPRAELQSLAGQFWDARAREQRLLAEQDNRGSISFPPTLEAARESNPGVAAILAGQQKIFETRRQVLQSQIAVIRERMAQVEQEIAGLQAQETAATKRAGIIREEVAAVVPLVEKGLERRPRLLSLQREMVEIDGRHGEAVAQIARARQVISEAQASLLKLENDRQNEISQTLRETQNQIFLLRERMRAIEDQLARTEVKAPEEGVITDLRIHTTGGVIGAGSPLMDLVPKEKLIVSVRIKPEDMDVVRSGLPADLHVLPYNQRRVPFLHGKVTYVSADRLTDRRTDQPYYAAKISLDDLSVAAAEGIEMIPGMPVQAFIKTGRGTVALYALRPLIDSFNRAFRED
jgi:HlyD family secretion protein